MISCLERDCADDYYYHHLLQQTDHDGTLDLSSRVHVITTDESLDCMLLPFASYLDNQPTRVNDRSHLDKTAMKIAVRGGVIHVLWVEQFWNFHLQKLDREIFEDGPSAKIRSLENF